MAIVQHQQKCAILRNAYVAIPDLRSISYNPQYFDETKVCPYDDTSFGIKRPISFTVREDIKYNKNVITCDKSYSDVFERKYDVIAAFLVFTEYTWSPSDSQFYKTPLESIII